MPFFLCCMGVKIRFCLLVLCYRNFFKKIGWVNTTIFLWRIHQEVPVYYMTYPKFISIRFLLSRPELIFSIRLLDLLWECRLYQMTSAFLQNVQKLSFFFIFYQKTAPNDKIRQKNDHHLIGFLVLVKKMPKWGISPYFYRRKVKPILQNLYTLLAHTNCMDTPPHPQKLSINHFNLRMARGMAQWT